jgi:hypothetical protein
MRLSGRMAVNAKTFYLLLTFAPMTPLLISHKSPATFLIYLAYGKFRRPSGEKQRNFASVLQDNRKMRLIFTFSTLHQVLAAEKKLRASVAPKFTCRPTPTPPGLSADICGMSLELLDLVEQDAAGRVLAEAGLSPHGQHLID